MDDKKVTIDDKTATDNKVTATNKKKTGKTTTTQKCSTNKWKITWITKESNNDVGKDWKTEIENMVNN